MSEFDKIITANYTPQELFALRRLVVRAWLLALERDDPERKAQARAFWAKRLP